MKEEHIIAWYLVREQTWRSHECQTFETSALLQLHYSDDNLFYQPRVDIKTSLYLLADAFNSFSKN